MCYNDETISVPQDAVNTMRMQGATCGSCDERCCPDELGSKIDMCLNDNTINVSRNACEGILNAGGTCGPCETVAELTPGASEPIPAPKKTAKKATK